MQTHGGARTGAGRPKGKGPYGEKTRVMRIPESQVERVKAFLEANGYKLPLYVSHVPAGSPAPAGSDIEEHIDVCSHVVKNPESSFCVRATGESMRDAGIHSGDILVVDSSLEPQHKNIVIAAINGETTVKRFYSKADIVKLLPENPDFDEIVLHKNDNVQIQGVVVHVMKDAKAL